MAADKSKARQRKGTATGNESTKAASQSAAAKPRSHLRSLLAIGALVVVVCFFWFRRFVSTGPQVYGIRVVKTFPHDPRAFTQGLLWLNGSLYESLGMYGESSVREVNLEDGKVVREVKNEGKEFGEGLVHWKGKLIQLLWRSGDVVTYTAKAGDGGHLGRSSERRKTPLSDAWGLETDGKSLLMTDSGSIVYYLDPESLAMQKKVQVSDGGRIVEMVNELEMVDGELWANIFGKECIARIAPETGEVRSWVVLQGILDRQKEHAAAVKKGIEPPDVLNGIAWDPETKRIFVTGKRWPRLYEIELVLLPSDEATLEQVRNYCIPATNIFHQ